MKRKIAICLAMLMLWMPYSAGKAMPEVSSHSACVIDIDTGRILAAKKENEKSEPASITKIMTALIALENADIKKVKYSKSDNLVVLTMDNVVAYLIKQKFASKNFTDDQLKLLYNSIKPLTKVSKATKEQHIKDVQSKKRTN